MNIGGKIRQRKTITKELCSKHRTAYYKKDNINTAIQMKTNLVFGAEKLCILEIFKVH